VQIILLKVISQDTKIGEDLMLDLTESGRKVCFHCTKHWSSHFTEHPSKLKKFLYKEPEPSFINLYMEVSNSGKADPCSWNCS